MTRYFLTADAAGYVVRPEHEIGWDEWPDVEEVFPTVENPDPREADHWTGDEGQRWYSPEEVAAAEAALDAWEPFRNEPSCERERLARENLRI